MSETAITVVAVLATLVFLFVMGRRFLRKWLQRPHELVGDPKKPQTRRWYLIKRDSLQMVLHHHLRSDVPYLHDHWWDNWTIVLKGRGTDWHTPTPETMAHLLANRDRMQQDAPPDVQIRIEDAIEGETLSVGRVIARKAADLHRIQLDAGTDLWTLFITGPKVRDDWGYVIDGKWRPWWKCEDLERRRID